MIRRAFVPHPQTLAVAFALAIGMAALPPAPLGAQVGYPPSQSPYEDLRGRQSLTFSPGLLNTSNDPAGVGPGSGVMLNARYEFLLTGPLWVTGRLGYAPGLDRTVKDPTITGPARIAGTDTDRLVLGDIGFAVNLTGNKAFRRVAPRVGANLGFVSTFDSAYDLGGYRFGTKFVISYGIGARYVTGKKWELSADLSHMFWQMEYPEEYAGDGTSTDTSILGRQNTTPWVGNMMLSVGVSRFFFR